MRRSLLLVVGAAIAGCTAGPTVHPGARPATLVASAKPASTPSAAVAAPSATPPAPEASTVPSVALAGTIALDAGFVIASGGGNLLHQDGAGVVSAGAGNLLDVGASLQGKSAAQLDALVGGTLIGHDGASVVSAGAGNLIGHDGASVVSAGAGNYRVLAADALPAGIYPALGAAVQVIALATDQPLTMVDDRGHAGDTVLTDGQGQFKVFIPRELQGNVIIRARIPGRLDQPKLAVDRLAAPAAASDIHVDAFSTTTTHFLRHAMLVKIANSLQVMRGGQDIAGSDQHETQAQLDQLRPLVMALQDAADTAHIEQLDDAQLKALARQMGDNTLGLLAGGADGQALDQLPVDTATWPYTGDPHDTALAAMRVALIDIYTHAKARLDADPGYFNRQAYVTLYKERLGGPAGFTITQPSEVSDFLINAFIANNDTLQAANTGAGVWEHVREVLVDIGDTTPDLTVDHLRGSTNALVIAAATDLLTHTDAMRQPILDAASASARARLTADGSKPDPDL